MYGHFSGGGQRERFQTEESLKQNETEHLPPPKERIYNRITDRFLSYLSVFQLDNNYVLNDALDIYDKIYGRRQTGKNGFRKSEYKERIAIAFSICNALIKQHAPRPPRYIAQICDIPTSALLNVQSKMSLNLEESPQLRKSDWKLQEIEAQDYIDPLCAELNIPFHIGTIIRATAEKGQSLLPGCYPTVIAATAIQLELNRKNLLGKNHISPATICSLLHCQQKSVNRIIHSLHQHVYPQESYSSSSKTERRRSDCSANGSYDSRKSYLRSDESSKSCAKRSKTCSRIPISDKASKTNEKYESFSKNTISSGHYTATTTCSQSPAKRKKTRNEPS